jgi:hypothetical protein
VGYFDTAKLGEGQALVSKGCRPLLTDRLAVDDVNELLQNGEYGLRVEQAGERLRLIDFGITLAGSATYADLYQVLVRLRRTRRRRDPVWLQQLTQLLDGAAPQGEDSAALRAGRAGQPPGGRGCCARWSPIRLFACAVQLGRFRVPPQRARPSRFHRASLSPRIQDIPVAPSQCASTPCCAQTQICCANFRLIDFNAANQSWTTFWSTSFGR